MIEVHSPIFKAFEPKFKLSFSYLLKVVGRFSRPKQFFNSGHHRGTNITLSRYSKMLFVLDSVASVIFFELFVGAFDSYQEAK